MTEICKFLNFSHSNFKLVTFTEETPNGKLHFLRSAMRTIFFKKQEKLLLPKKAKGQCF